MIRSRPAKTRADRRRFLHDVAAAAGLAVAGSAAGSAPTAAAPPADSTADDPRGYRVTPHVAKYYAKARL